MCIISFTAADPTLEKAGGKGMNLSRLTRAGFAVPRGFIIATSAYRSFVEHNQLLDAIAAALEHLSADDARALDAAAQQVRAAFAAGVIPADIRAAILAAFEAFASAKTPAVISPVAVRSSATAEDLPGMSFAGQQDTYLNVIGAEPLLKAVVDCWSSLWTARAIGYRAYNQIDHQQAALAVVVQEMVASEVSGVLFTANPLTGRLDESVIDAVFGLGEALVSGQVEPDHYVVETASGAIRQRAIGAKQVATRAMAGGGVSNAKADGAAQQTLTDTQVAELVKVGHAIESTYGGAPQDIEWAMAGGRLLILQARAITSLFPVPKVAYDPLIVWMSFGAVQGIVGPMTPLGLDVVRQVMAGAGRLFGRELRPDEIDMFGYAGERVWIKISDLLRNPFGNHLPDGVLAFVEPSIGSIITGLIAEPRLHAGEGVFRMRTLWRLVKFFTPLIPKYLRAMLHPEQARTGFDAAIEAAVRNAHLPAAADRFARLASVVAFIRSRDGISNAFAFALKLFFPVFAPAMTSMVMLRRMTHDETRVAEVMRGLQDNVTTSMDLALWQTSRVIGADTQSKDFLTQHNVTDLAQLFLGGQLPAVAQETISDYMKRYGMRGTGEIDMGTQRWREDPAPVVHVLQSYLQVDPSAAPDVQIERSRKSAQEAIETLAANVHGPLRKKLVRGMARRIRVLMGARESPKFFIIRLMGIARAGLLEAGREYVAAGTIERADDLAYLRLTELDELARPETQREWKKLIAERRAVYEREQRRRQVPRVLVSDGRAFYEGVGAGSVTENSGDTIVGSPVSPGSVEGIVHVVFDPREARLAPGEILVCPGTDPAWTPLFMAAGGLITEVGGMMTHGSVVAREYGIPAVVAVDHATQRLHTGQRIRMDGTNGRITLLDG
ncbi:MAG TPA: PEP/pyruvate-binding domain-containing protein [Anaerolineae bacterium]